jgi:hypothetical protein
MERVMKQLTIRGFDKELERRILELARSEGISLNQAVIRLLRKGSGIGPRSRDDAIGNALDDLSGTWTAEEEREFLDAIRPLERVDEELWR